MRSLLLFCESHKAVYNWGKINVLQKSHKHLKINVVNKAY